MKKQIKLLINPPPQDKCCECCGKNIKDLKPFGKAGDPLVGDFDGVLLVKTFRTMFPESEDWEIKKNNIEKICDIGKDNTNWEKFEENYIKTYGQEDWEKFCFYDQLVNTVEASWECRECICLDTNEFFIKNGIRCKK